MEYYTLDICGLKRDLPLIQVGRKTRLAQLSILGDVELVDCLTDKFAEKLKNIDVDYLVGPEVKVVPLLHEVAKRLGHQRYIVCRKKVKPYMVAPVILEPLPYFPKHVKQLVLNGSDAQLLKGRKVVVIDDVISTGVTMRMMLKLMEKVGAKVVKILTVVKQGEPFDKFDNWDYDVVMPIIKDEN